MKNLIVAAVFAVTVSFTAAAQDATTADPKHYKVMLDNEYVRILKVSYGPKEKSILHQHPDAVAVSLSGMQGKFTSADGKSENRSFKAGEVRWSPAETHTPENAGTKPVEVILVELKALPAGATATAVPDSEDPVKVDGARHKVEFENDRVRVLRVKSGAKEKSPMHGHPANAVIPLTDVRVRSTLPDGKTEETSLKAGEAVWRPALKHASENMTDKPFEVVIVELKGT